MSDRDVVGKILSLAPDGRFFFDGDFCVSVDLTDATDPFFGIVRFSEDKKEIVRLLSRLEKIESLNLRKNCFNEPIEINASNLIRLNLSSNYMKRVPECIRFAYNLEELELGVNELYQLPEWSLHKNLKVLKIHKNNISHLPNLGACSSLEVLNLYFNRFRTIPDCIWNLENMSFFSWGVSGLSEIPYDISRWKNLRYLSFVSSKIEHLPDCICDIKHLKGLRLQKNRIRFLPKRIGMLSELEHLTIFSNLVSILPISFFDLRLKKLNLGMNPLSLDDIRSASKISSDFFFGGEVGK